MQSLSYKYVAIYLKMEGVFYLKNKKWSNLPLYPFMTYICLQMIFPLQLILLK